MCSTQILILVFVLLVFILLFINIIRSKREYYGGAVKRIHKIPKTTCYGICGQHYQRCMAENQYIDADYCRGRYNNCVSVCNYSDYHRM